MMKKGIVLLPVNIPRLGTVEYLGQDTISRHNLRHYLMYWDQIDIADNNAARFGLSPDLQYLSQENVVIRTKVHVDRGELSRIFLVSQLAAYRMHEADEPGAWMIAQPDTQLRFPGLSVSTERSLSLELSNVLPTPTEDTPLDVILEFKDRRKDELIALRSHLDELALQLGASADASFAKRTAQTRIARIVEDVWKSSSESFRVRISPSVKLEFSADRLGKGIIPALITFATTNDLSWSLGLGAVGAVASSLKVDFPFTRQTREVPSYSAYLYGAAQERLIGQ